MKKLFFLLLIPFYSIAQVAPPNDSCFKNPTGTQTGQALVLDSASTVRILNSVQKSETDSLLKWIIPLLLTVAAIGLTFRAQGRDKLYKDLAFLTEVDKMLVNNPELWAIYDVDRQNYGKDMVDKEVLVVKVNPLDTIVTITKSGTEEKLWKEREFDFEEFKDIKIQGNVQLTSAIKMQQTPLTEMEKIRRDDRLRAFCYFKLNNFEAAVERNQDDHVDDAWLKYMVHTILNSSIFKMYWRKKKGISSIV